MRKTSSRRPIFYGWVIVATTFVIAAVTTGPRNGFGVFVGPMSTDFGWNRSTISLAAAIGFLVNGLSQPFLGRLYDRCGGRRVIVASLALFGVGTICLSLTFNALFFILLFGLGLSIAWSGASLTTTNALLTRWFQRQRATVLGLSTAGASAGGLLLIPLATSLLDRTDWRLTWVALGALILVLALPLALGAWPFWQLAGAYGICGFTTAILTTHFIPYALDRGFTASTAAAAFGLMSGLNVAGVIAAGALADRWGRKNLLAWVYAARGGAYAMLVLAPDPWSLWGFAAIAGFSYWATAPLTMSLMADVYGLRSLGTLNGLSFLVHQVGGATSIQFAGLMRDLTGSYTVPFTLAGLLLLPAALAAFSIREQQYSGKYQRLPASTSAVAPPTSAPLQAAVRPRLRRR
jgi:MFS family permease